MMNLSPKLKGLIITRTSTSSSQIDYIKKVFKKNAMRREPPISASVVAAPW